MSDICRKVHQLFARLPKYGFPFDSAKIPDNGIYVLFEVGETGHGLDRIVRIGTHTGDHQLRSRLEQHYINENKDRSIFRKHIGRAILNRDHDAFLDHWEIDLTTRANRDQYAGVIDRRKLQQVEAQVSAYIRSHFRFVMFAVNNKAQRLDWESKLISAVAQCNECRPSRDWLGRFSPNAKIRESGLWLVNELYNEPLSEWEFEALSLAVLKGAQSRSRSM